MDIDFVVLWVDGNDPAWLAEKNRFSPVKIDDSNSNNRYRDWGLMKYWFRAVEKFTPWVRTVHFVTWGHLPSFLNIHAKKLNIVRHYDYIPKEYLPTFNANTIEMNLHRISSLSEHFVYFNDDMFLLQPMNIEDFFCSKSGLPKTQASEIPICLSDNETWQYIVMNDMYIINKYYDKINVLKHNFLKFINFRYPLIDIIRTIIMGIIFPKNFYGFKNFHAPAAYRKETFQEVWEKERELLHNTSMHKFRNKEDVNQWLLLWWQVVSGNFLPRRMNTITFAPNEDNINKLEQIIQSQNCEFICINDPSECISQKELAVKIQEAFEKLLPEKSSFEL